MGVKGLTRSILLFNMYQIDHLCPSVSLYMLSTNKMNTPRYNTGPQKAPPLRNSVQLLYKMESMLMLTAVASERKF